MNNVANAYTMENAGLMAVYEQQFSDRLAPAMDAWLATDPLANPDAPVSPLAIPEYIVPEQERAD